MFFFKESGKETPDQYFPTSGFEDVAYSADNVRAEDVNFDGYFDIVVPFRRLYDLQFYYVYVWDGASGLLRFVPDMTNIGDFKVGDGIITGYYAEHGEPEQFEFVWKDGNIVNVGEVDETVSIAEEYAREYLGSDDVRAVFVRDELIDMAISRLFFIYEKEEIVSYIAVSYTKDRVFASPMTDVYTELIRDGDALREDGEYSREEYKEGDKYGYVREGYLNLGEKGKELYDEIASEIAAFEPVDIQSPDAPAAMDAYIKDNPLCSLFFVPEISGYSVKGKYYYSWEPYAAQADAETMRGAADEYSVMMEGAVSEMPTGLSQTEKYVYLAEKLRLLSEEEHHTGTDSVAGLYIPGDSLGEKAAKTYAFMCELADVYCTWDGEINCIIVDGEKRRVNVYDTYPYSPGTDGWFEKFYMGDIK